MKRNGIATVLRYSRVQLSFILLCAGLATFGVTQSSSRAYVPPELQASDPQIKALVDSVEKMQEEGHYSESFQQLQKAYDLCVNKSLLTDKALVEAKLGTTLFVQGRLDEAKQQWLNALSDSITTNNLVLQADTLVALSAMAQSAGNLNEALELATRAVEMAGQSKNLFIQSRSLGELGRLQLNMNKSHEARISVEEALRIDRLNQYSLEASHLLYLAWIAYTPAKPDEGIRFATSARELAIKNEDYLTFMQASESLGQAYVRQNALIQAIVLLEHSRDGVDENGKALFKHPASYHAATLLPYPRVVFLESMALTYEAGQREDDALNSWQQLEDVAQASGFALASAEAAHHMGDICQRKKEFAKAATYYELAGSAWKKAGNLPRQIDAFSSEAYVMFQSGENDKSAHIYEGLLPLVKAVKDSRREFLFNLAIAESLQPKGDAQRTMKALHAAESLLSSDLTLAGVEPNAVLELYIRLAGVHQSANEQLSRLIALEKAMTPAGVIGKTEGMAQLAVEIRKTLESIQAVEVAKKAYQDGDVSKALEYFELVQHFEETHARWNGKLEEYNKTPNEILNTLWAIPYKLIDTPGGAVSLETNLHQMGPIAARVNFPILWVLVRYYTREGNPEKVITFATAALPYLHLGDNDQLEEFDVELTCDLSYALLLQKEIASALRQTDSCLRTAKKFGNPRLLGMAHQINVWVLQAAGRQNEAQESARFLMDHMPDDPMHYVELAQLKMQDSNMKEAADAWRKALELFQARKDLVRVASVHLLLASALSSGSVGSDREELLNLEAALSLYTQLKDIEGQSRANASLGRYFARKRDFGRARNYFDAALKLSKQANNLSDEAYALSDMGDAYRAAGESAMALDAYRKAADDYHAVKDLADEAFQLRNVSWALDDLHKPEEAFEAALKAKIIADNSGAWRPRYWVRRLLAPLFEQRGDYQSGLVVLREARTISATANQPLSAAWAGLSLATSLIVVGEFEEALNLLNQCLPIFRQFKDTTSEAQAYSLLVDIHSQRESDLKDFPKALEYYQAALRLAEQTDPSRKALLSLTVEEIYWQQNRFKEARASAQEALDYYVRNKDEWGQANALLSLAEIERSDGDIREARTTLTRAEPLVKRANDFYMTGRLFYSQANQLKKEGHLKEAIARYERVVDLLEQFKSTADAGVRKKASESYSYIYDELSDVWHSLSDQDPQQRAIAASKSLQYAELNKSRVFTSSWGQTFVAALRRQLPSRLQEEERSLVVRRDALQSELQQSLSGQGQRTAQTIRSDLETLSKEQAALEQELRRANPAYAETRYPQVVSISSLPLHPGETLIEFKVLKDGLLVWIIGQSKSTQGLLAFYKVSRPREWFEERVLSIRSAFNRAQPEQFDPHIAEELFDTLFPSPVAQYVLNAQSIVYIPDDILFLLPFEILSPKASQDQYVLLKIPTTYFPSAAALRLARAVAPSRPTWSAQFFGLADPITSTSDERYGAASILSEAVPLKAQSETSQPESRVRSPLPADLKLRDYFFTRLPDTAAEVNSIASLFSSDATAAVVRSGMNANKRELLQTDLGRFRFIHFATHGFYPVEPGIREPALVLSYDGSNEAAMMLSLSEVLQLRLHAEMVVLSACNTGSGKVTRAEGVTSLGTAFLAAGASSVTVSLWKVSDKSTAILMKEFYGNLIKGMSKPAALAAARSALIDKGYRNPFFWGPFVLSGE